MAQFITRIELHGTNHNETPYQILHDAMAANGFKRTIAGETGAVYHLPTAEYEITGNYTTRTVLESAKQAASLTNKTFSIIVNEIRLASFYNLKPV